MELATTDVEIFGKCHKVFGSPHEGWFKALKETGKFTEFNLEHLREVIGPDSVCIDAGANLGMMTLAMASLASKGKVYAFEPSAITYKALCKTVQAAGLDDIVSVSSNVLGKAGDCGKWMDDHVWASSSHYIPGSGSRPAYAIDDMKLDRVDLIKIDVEGAELDVLEGAKDTLARCHPVCLIEFNCFAFVYYRNILPRDALNRILAIFPFVAYYQKRTGPAIMLDDPELFLRNNMLGGLVDDMICGWPRQSNGKARQ